jgi:hypothetical protein
MKHLLAGGMVVAIIATALLAAGVFYWLLSLLIGADLALAATLALPFIFVVAAVVDKLTEKG